MEVVGVIDCGILHSHALKKRDAQQIFNDLRKILQFLLREPERTLH
jgi:hypothetical protein